MFTALITSKCILYCVPSILMALCSCLIFTVLHAFTELVTFTTIWRHQNVIQSAALQPRWVRAVFSNINTTLGRWTINKLSTSTQICSPNIAEDWRGSKICNPYPAEAFSYQILAPLHASSLIGRLLWSGLWLAASRLQWHSKVYYSIAITACPTILHQCYHAV